MRLAAVATAAGVAYALGWLTRQPQVVAARREASTDALTHLVNRHGLKHQLQIRADRHHPYTLYMIDLNGFKPINDTLGHRAGDELLCLFGRRLTACFPGQVIARLGGDEFVILDDARDSDLAGQIEDVLTRSFRVFGSPEAVTLGAAIGSVRAAAGTDPEVALHTADLAMYRSKKLGRPSRAGVLITRSADETSSSRTTGAPRVRVA